MKINWSINQVLNENQVEILNTIAEVVIVKLKHDPCEWDNLSIISIYDIEIKYIVKRIDNYIELQEVIYNSQSQRLYSTIVGAVEGVDSIIVKTL